MADGTKNTQTNEQPKELEGWADIRITPDMPLSALVNFLNVLNQRLCAVENIVSVQTKDGKTISLTQLYKEQAEENLNSCKAQ